jgi:hypothetical protein
LLFLIGVCMELRGASSDTSSDTDKEEVEDDDLFAGFKAQAQQEKERKQRIAEEERRSEAALTQAQTDVAANKDDPTQAHSGWCKFEKACGTIQDRLRNGNVDSLFGTLIDQDESVALYGSGGLRIARCAQWVRAVCIQAYNDGDGLSRVKHSLKEAEETNRDLRTQLHSAKNSEAAQLQKTIDGSYAKLHAAVLQRYPGFQFFGVEISEEEKIDQMLKLLSNHAGGASGPLPASSNAQAGPAPVTPPTETPALQPRFSTGIGGALAGAGIALRYGTVIRETIENGLQSPTVPAVFRGFEEELWKDAGVVLTTAAAAGAAGYIAMEGEKKFSTLKPENRKKFMYGTGAMGVASFGLVAAPRILAAFGGQEEQKPFAPWEKKAVALSGTSFIALWRMTGVHKCP